MNMAIRKISDEDYLESARRRLRHLLNIGYSPDEIRGKIQKHTHQCQCG